MISPKSSRSGVYQIRNCITQKTYFGSTTNFSRRYGNHSSKLRKGKHENKNLQQAYDEYGNDAFAFELLFFVDDPGIMYQIETSYLDEELDADVYNVSRTHRGGSFTLDKHPNGEAIRRKLSAAQTGRTLSPETRDKLRKQKRGENNVIFSGYYETPRGRFASSYAAGEAFVGLITGRTLQICCKDAERVICKRSYDQNKYLKTLGKGVIGQRWSDLGFGFTPVSKH